MGNPKSIFPQWFKLHHLYYFLAGFDLLTITISLFLSSQILHIYSASVDQNKDWSTRQALATELMELATEVNAPGNDVFVSRTPDEEQVRLQEVWSQYRNKLEETRRHLVALPEVDSIAIHGILDQADRKMVEVLSEAGQIFQCFIDDEVENAGQRMTRMDQSFAEALGCFNNYSRSLVSLQQRSLSQESEHASALGKYEWLIMGVVVFLVGGVVYYGHALAHRLECAEKQRHAMQRELIESSRMAGMAEVATGVLHNVGNVLNSVNVGVNSIGNHVRRSDSDKLDKVLDVLEQNQANLSQFLTSEKGNQMVGYLQALSQSLQDEKGTLLEEVQSIIRNVDHIKTIVSMQQSLATNGNADEAFELVDVLQDALKINESALSRHQVDVQLDVQSHPVIFGDRHKLLQILNNLISNANQAMRDVDSGLRRIEIGIQQSETNCRLDVKDRGCGISEENLNRIFAFGFTTKSDGHGFGLHSSALSAKELGGELRVESDGVGHGACFTLVLPLPVRKEAPEAAQSDEPQYEI